MMKHLGSTRYAEEEYFTVKDVAARLKVCTNTARKIMKSDPRCRFLPRTPGQGSKRRAVRLPVSAMEDLCRTLLIP